MSATFSESWYQVATLRLGLLPTIRIHKQIYRDQVWYVLQDSCSEKYYRVQEPAYLFLARLTPERTVEELWIAFTEEYPEDAPSQDAVIMLLSQLHQMSLLFFRSQGKSESIFERYAEQRRKEKLSHLLAFLYFRIPLWNPNEFLKNNIGWLQRFFSRWSFVGWLLVVLFGAKSVIDHFGSFTSQAQGILAVDNLLWLYVAMFLLKFLHEMGHAIACRRSGGDVYTLGVMFIALAPLPYIDVSSSWSMRSKWHRAFVGVSGLYVELFFAALAAIVWGLTAPGFVNGLAFNIMIIGSISSFVFNGNPLLKFDAYYVLSDLIDLPNLYQKAGRQWHYIANVVLLGTKDAQEPAENRNERYWYYGYGAASFGYRLFVMVAILLYMADLSLFLGVLMLLAMCYMWLIGPTLKLVQYLRKSSELRQNRRRAIVVSAVTPLLILLVLATFPLPYALVAPGVLLSEQRMPLYAEAGGTLTALVVRSGDTVQQGSVLMEFINPELELEYELTGQQLVETRWLIRKATDGKQGDLKALYDRESFLVGRLDELDKRLDRLKTVAPTDGIWVSDVMPARVNSHFMRGERLGVMITPGKQQFVGVVTQEQAGDLFGSNLLRAEIRLPGQFTSPLESHDLQFIPYQKHELPSSALALQGGGTLFAQADAQGRLRTDEPFFEVIARFSESPTAFYDGAPGVMRIALSPRPLLEQIALAVRQLLQSRYQIQ
ncbi:hypothetical protein [Chrysiogenes arsenatis]|uniref:hypothetical protein n=1 Tax=Chrysiogenes arsenatis TaxID=309797 RepID=UPI0004118667|nr:hypothetical protein [Chrysiogenes arsenatis]